MLQTQATAVEQKNALVLAYLGDAVFSLMVREHFVNSTEYKANTLNKLTNSIVCAKNQALLMQEIKPILTEVELDVVMRARNAHSNNKAKNSTLAEYNLATQFEALIGYWYLENEKGKLDNMFQTYVVNKL